VRKTIGLAALVVGAVSASVPAQAAASTFWQARMGAAARYADNRAGLVSFAVVDEAGRLHGHRASSVAPSASVLKAMLLVAYLRRPSVRDRPLTLRERGLLGPMIRRSDNYAASTVLSLVGPTAVSAFARRVGMVRFRLHVPIWGLSEITAAEQARFFNRIDGLVPARHRAYALRLLETVVPSQRWGIGRVAHAGWHLYFKGGWGSGTGLVDHQVALLTAGGERVSLAILTRSNPNHAYGKETLRGVAARLLRGLPRPRYVTAPAAAYAYDGGYSASLDTGCATLRLRALATGARATVATAIEACGSVQLALGGSRALWSWTNAPEELSHVATARLEEPMREDLATLEGAEVLRSLAGGGTTVAFSHDTYGSDGEFAGGSVSTIGGTSCPTSESAMVAADSGRIAIASSSAIEVRDAASCEVKATFTPGGTVQAIALGGDLLAALVSGGAGAKRIERYSMSAATLLRSSAVSSATAPLLEVAGGWVLYRVGRAFAALAAPSAQRWILWRPRRAVVGFGATGRRAAWAENFAGRGRVWALVLPGG
jgi:beta-lactamase family protein